MLRSFNALGRAQNTNVQNDDVHCSRSLSGYYRHDKGNLMTTLQPRTNEQKNNIVLPFSPVGKSKSCCFICKSKNICNGTAKPRVTLFCSITFSYQWASFVANTTFLIVWIHIFSKPRWWRGRLERLPRKVKVRCSNSSSDRPKLYKQIVTAPLSNVRHGCECHRSLEMNIIKGCPVSKYVWHAKEQSLLNDHRCRAFVKICSHSLVMVLLLSAKNSLSNGTKKQTNKQTNIFSSIILLAVSLIKIWLLTCSCLLKCHARHINTKSKL